MIFRISFHCVVLLHLALSIPIRENAQWTMLLCKFKNNSFIPHTKEWFENWLKSESTPATIASYFHLVSNGLYSTSKSRVFDWFELPYSKDQLYNLATTDSRFDEYSDPTRKLYLKTKDACFEYARENLKINLPSARHVITVINDEDTAVFCKENGVLVAPRFTMTAAVSHEMVHSFFLGHSYSDLNVKVFSYSQLGEYDDRYDLMSTANAYMSSTPIYGSTGPGLNGPHLDYLGWLPADRIYYFGRDGNTSSSRTIRLSSLSRPHPQTQDWLLILIPYDRDDPQKVYTVELRTKEHLDAGIQKSAAIVVHQIFRKGGYLYSKILTQGGRGPDYELRAGAEWLAFLDRRGYRYIRLRVDWISEPSATSQVTIYSSFAPTACRKGEIPRSIYPDDLQCVSVAERSAVIAQNDRRHTTESAPGRCLPGYVKREAEPNDDVCVTLNEKELIQRQNERWLRYKEFFHQPTFGLNACKSGYVWRLIDQYDYVCVEESRLHEIEKANNDVFRRATFLSDCFGQYVFRRAFFNDDICVSLREKELVEIENKKNIERLLYARFFNGDDKIE